MHYFGHLVNPDGFNTSLIRPEMYEIFNNFQVWISYFSIRSFICLSTILILFFQRTGYLATLDPSTSIT